MVLREKEPSEHPFNDDTCDRVGVILYDLRARILIVENKGGKFSLPKGCRHRGETDYEGAMRELWEETGIDIEDLVSKGIARFVSTQKLRWGNYYIFQLCCEGEQIQTHADYSEIDNVYWRNPYNKWIRQQAELNIDLRTLITHINKTTRKPKLTASA